MVWIGLNMNGNTLHRVKIKPMKPILLFIVVLSLIKVTSCGDDNAPPLAEKFYTITIRNQSSESIYFYFAGNNAEIQYPDTTLPSNKPSLIKVKPDDYFQVDSRNPWKEEIKKLPADTLSVYIFDSDTYQDSAWSKIKNEYLVLKRYDLSYEDIEKRDFEIKYP